MNSGPTVPSRLDSIDALRGVTMLLMIWVNDFWTLREVPFWLQHMPAEADALGFSDTIFPAFLLIVGLSIPFALRSRRARGSTTSQLQWRIAERSFALIAMGWFMVNLEYANAAAMPVPKVAWQLAMILAFALIWNAYPASVPRRIQNILRGLGFALLALLAFAYRGGVEDAPTWMRPHWWGILGLIGWSYLICATATLQIGSRPLPLASVWLAFSIFNIGVFAGWFDALSGLKQYVWIVGDGSMPALTMAGTLVSTVYLQSRESGRENAFLAFLVLFGLILVALGLGLRPLWGISKIQATPAWTQLCSGLTLLAFAAIHWVVDWRRARRWTAVLGAAGTATLTCYLVPYLAYPLLAATGVELPDWLSAGIPGLAKSLAFAFAIVWITAALRRAHITLRL